MADNIQIQKENVKTLFESPYLRVADLQYAPGKHYYDATRRDMEDLTAVKSDAEFAVMLADAVKPDVLVSTAVREIREETGLEIRDTDTVRVVNPLVFSTPGLTDESNALMCAVLHSAQPTDLSQEGAVGSEQFDGFCLLTKAQAREVLKKGRDQRGKFYPLYTWAALMYFVSDMWREA